MRASSGNRGPAGPGSVLRTLLPSLLAVVLVAAAFGITVGRSLALDLQAQPPMWVVNAIPPALSELAFGHAKRYTILVSVRDRFYAGLPEHNPSAKAVNLAMRKVRELNLSRIGTAYVLMGPDDKGIVDLVELSFLMFGYATENVTLLYFAILAASCLLYVAAFWHSPSRLLLLAAFLAMLYLVLPMVAYHGQLRSMLALRTLPVLAMVACLHCLVFMAGSLEGRVRAWQIVPVALQVALMTFTIHLRATTLWQVLTVVGFGIVVLAVARFRRFGAATACWRSTGAAVVATLGLVVVGYTGLQVYQRFGLPDEYRRGQEIATRVFWHNIFSGLAYHPELAARYQLRIDDSSIFAATRDYLAETGRLDLWRDMGGEEPDFSGLQFAKYDPVVREMLVARCSSYLRECAEVLLYYKPVALAGNLAWVYGLRDLPPNLDIVVSRIYGSTEVKDQTLAATEQMDRNGQRAYLWTPVVLLIVLPFGLLLTRESRTSIWRAFAALGGLTAGSLIPTVIGYPVAHTILEATITVGMLVYVGLCVAIVAWRPALAARGLPGRREAETSAPLPTTVQ
jgi:hypothetical protein